MPGAPLRLDPPTHPDAGVPDGDAVEVDDEVPIGRLISLDKNVSEEPLDVGGVREHRPRDVAEHVLGIAEAERISVAVEGPSFPPLSVGSE